MLCLYTTYFDIYFGKLQAYIVSIYLIEITSILLPVDNLCYYFGLKLKTHTITYMKKDDLDEEKSTEGTDTESEQPLTSQKNEGKVIPKKKERSSPKIKTILVSDAELHYKNLIDFFKTAVTILGIVVAGLGIVVTVLGIILTIVFYLTYSNMAAMREEVRQNLSDAKSEIRQNVTDMKTDTNSAINDAKSAVDDAKKDAKDTIEYTKNTTDKQVSQIRDQSASIALNEAQQKVDSAFRSNNVEAMVENAAKREVGPVIDRQVRTEVDREMNSVQKDLTYLGKIADAGTSVRLGFRKGLNQLITLQKNAPNDVMRQRVESLLNTITDDYERVSKEELDDSSVREFLSNSKNSSNVIADSVKSIREEQNLSEIATEFIILRAATGYPFKMFDFQAVENWCSQHSNECKIK